jgi:hypothetical protein
VDDLHLATAAQSARGLLEQSDRLYTMQNVEQQHGTDPTPAELRQLTGRNT